LTESDRLVRRPASESLIAYAALFALALVVAIPVLRGDFAAYLDNPVHLAEIAGLARPDSVGWSELAFCGFPLGSLQSPLTFGGLARLVRLGLPLEPLYAALSVIGLAAPAWALFHVASKRVSSPLAFGLASTLLLYRGALVGSAAPLAGMFGFHLAAGALLLVLDCFTAKERSLRTVAAIASLTAFIGLTHVYITIALVHATLVHCAWSAWRRDLKRLVFDLPALSLGAVGASAYWMPNLLARTSAKADADSFARILSRLVTTSVPAPPAYAHDAWSRLLADPVLYLDVLPQCAGILLAFFGLRYLKRTGDALPIYGALIAALFLVLMATQPYTKLPLLGPQGERQIYIVKLSVLLLALPAVQVLGQRFRNEKRLAAVTVAIVFGFALLSERVVDREAVDRNGRDLATLDELWASIRDERALYPGRIYVQGTFEILAGDNLNRSHIMARTADRTGVEQVGEYYGNTPYSLDWLYERSLNDGVDAAGDDVVSRTVEILRRANASQLLLVVPRQFAEFRADSRFKVRRAIGRFLLLDFTGAPSAWATALTGSGSVAVERLAPGHIHLKPEAGVTSIAIAESYHPFWHVFPSGAATLGKGLDGFMRVERNTQGSNELDLRYVPPRLSIWATWLGVLGILCVFAVSTRRRV
jgi:hypothetical protein